MQIDQIFTTEEFAIRISKSATVRSVKKVGDFAVGDGALLAAARVRWPKATMYGLDLDPEIVPKLRGIVIGCTTHCGDFLNGAASHIARAWGNDFDLVLLNPPFSIRNHRLREIVVGSHKLLLSPAAAFLVDSTRFVRRGGQIVAIIPHGVWHSERDAMARTYLERKHAVEVVDGDVRNAFKDVDVRCMIVKITIKKTLKIFDDVDSTNDSSILETEGFRVIRGAVNHVTTKGKKEGGKTVKVIHSTNLVDNKIVGAHALLRGLDPSALLTAPYAVIMPRVGRPSCKKIAVIERNRSQIGLTQCVLAVECPDLAGALRVKKLLQDRWCEVALIYGGTAAQYTTIARLEALLVQLLRL